MIYFIYSLDLCIRKWNKRRILIGDHFFKLALHVTNLISVWLLDFLDILFMLSYLIFNILSVLNLGVLNVISNMLISPIFIVLFLLVQSMSPVLFFLEKYSFQLDFLLHLYIVLLQFDEVFIPFMQLKCYFFLEIFLVLLGLFTILSFQKDLLFGYFILYLQNIPLCFLYHSVPLLGLIFCYIIGWVKILS